MGVAAAVAPPTGTGGAEADVDGFASGSGESTGNVTFLLLLSSLGQDRRRDGDLGPVRRWGLRSGRGVGSVGSLALCALARGRSWRDIRGGSLLLEMAAAIRAALWPEDFSP